MPQPSLSTYHPSLGERLQQGFSGLLGKAGVDPRYANHLGSRIFGALNDLTPLGNATMAADAGTMIRNGYPFKGAGMGALAVLPGPAAKLVGKGMFAARKGIKAFAENGKPVRFYHGTSAAIDEFDPAKIGKGTDAGKLGQGFYFSARPDIASSYAQLARPTGKEIAPNVIPAHLQLNNPVTFDAGDGGDLFTKLRKLSGEWNIPHDPVTAADNAPNPLWSEMFTEAARQRGHDGALLRFPDGGHEAVVFSPEQIRSIFAR